MLIVGEAINVRGQRVHGKSVYLSLNFAVDFELLVKNEVLILK